MKTSFKLIKALNTEKVLDLIEKENKLAFLVDRRANKSVIKKELESFLGVKIEKINTMITPQGKKKVYVKFPKDVNAMDVATKLGLV